MTEVDDEFLDNKVELNVINTNARSLRPKTKSFIKCFISLSLTIAVVTETWLANGSRLESDVETLLHGHGLAIHYLNREPSMNGVCHGGVAIVLKNNVSTGKRFSFPNPEAFEVLPMSVDLCKVKRKLFVIAAYIPPNYTVVRGRACLSHINDIALEMKRCVPDALIMVAGDFNQWEIGEILLDFADLHELDTPPTRGDRRIDRIFTNWSEDISDCGVLPPLDTSAPDDRITYSDHGIQYLCSRIPGKEPTQWETYSYRPYNEQQAEKFLAELALTDWGTVYEQEGSNNMAIRLQFILDELMDSHFPLKTVRRKESDLPWFNAVAKRMTKKKMAIYKAEGKSPRWHAQCDKLEAYLACGRENFLKSQRDKLLGPTATTNFFKNVRAFKSADRPKQFNIRELRPGRSDMEIATEAAAFFNRISSEFEELNPNQIPFTYHRDLPLLSPAQVQKLLIDAKKTTSMVPGDLFPKMVNRCAPYISLPLAAIYNEAIRSHLWPVHWKREYVSLIPKKAAPKDFPDLRNISCTLFVSKILERHVLTCLLEEISLKTNQYGGVKGCSTTHMIVDLLQEICENAEDYRSATVLCAIDFAKAFNRMSFQHCLDSLKKKHASTPLIRLIASFLTNRTMTLRVGSYWSEPLPVSGGCPQGSLLGVILFNSTTEFLEDEFMAQEQQRLSNNPPPQVLPAQQGDVPRDEPPGAVCSSPSPETDFRLLKMDLSPINKPTPPHESYSPVPKSINLPKPVLVPPPVEEKVGTQVLIHKAVGVFKYIDDNISVDKVNFGQVNTTLVDGKPFKFKLAVNLQNGFRSITRKAEELGMVINSSKTQLLTVSDALHYRPRAFIFDHDNNKIESVTSMNVLGFHLSDRPNVNAHVDAVVKKMRMRYWTLFHLRKLGFSEQELVTVYKTMILPIHDYCSPAYHSMLTDVHDQVLERTQIGALRSIFGYTNTATELRRNTELETLRERRIRLTDNFARKCLSSDRFKHWFPRNENRRGRQAEEFKEFFAKCDRLKNSPLYYMRRRLNGKEGKTYGERNRRYRENFNLEEN